MGHRRRRSADPRSPMAATILAAGASGTRVCRLQLGGTFGASPRWRYPPAELDDGIVPVLVDVVFRHHHGERVIHHRAAPLRNLRGLPLVIRLIGLDRDGHSEAERASRAARRREGIDPFGIGALCSPLPTRTLGLPVSGVMVTRWAKPAFVKAATLTNESRGRYTVAVFGIAGSFGVTVSLESVDFQTGLLVAVRRISRRRDQKIEVGFETVRGQK